MPISSVRLLGLMLFVCLPGCDPAALDESAGDQGPSDPGADMAPPAYPAYSPQNPAICGQTPYQLRPAAQVGQLLERRDGLYKTAVEMQARVTAARLAGEFNVRRATEWSVRTAVIRYQTQDRGQLVDATAMIAYPSPLLPGTRRFPTALVLHPTLGYVDACAPSRGVGDSLQPMTFFAELTASFGYVAVFPDYINMRSLGSASPTVTPYLLAEPTAIASLDAVRAAQAYLKAQGTDAQPNGELYVWGHSQGGQATEYVLALAPHYAPELNIRAAAVVAPPSDLIGTSLANFAGPEPLLVLGDAMIYAWSQYYGGAALATALLPPWDQSAPEQVRNYCTSGYKDPLRMVTDPAKVFTPGFLGVFQAGTRYEPWSCWLHYNNPATMDLPLQRVPLLYVTGDKDVTVPTSGNLPTVQRWCQDGMAIQYKACSGADHVGVVKFAFDEVYDFFAARQAGKPLTGSCQFGAPVRCASTP